MKSIAQLIEYAVILGTQKRSRRSPSEGESLNSDSPSDRLGWLLPDIGLPSIGPLTFLDEDRRRHTYILGGTGSGKTNLNLQLIARDLASGRSLVVVDLRGDLIDRVLKQVVAAKPKVSPSRVKVLDLRDSDRIIGFNPLIGSGEAHARAYLVLDAIRTHSDSWGVQLDETLRNSLVALAESNLSLLDIEPLLTDGNFRTAIVSRSTDQYVQAFFSRFDALSPERQQGWILPVLNKVTPFTGIPRLRLLMGASNTIDLKQIIDTPQSILLVALAVDRFHSAARLVGSFLIGALETAIMGRVDTPEEFRVLVNLYIDEFETMATEAFSSIVAEGRRFGLALTLSHQNLTQIPQSLRQVIRNNVLTQIFFQTGSLDARELKHEFSSEEGEEVVRRIQTLPVGHAFFCQRPNEPALVKFDLARRPQVADEEVEFFKHSVYEAMGAMTEDAANEACVERRVHLLKRGGVTEIDRTSSIRHSRLPRSAGEADEN